MKDIKEYLLESFIVGENNHLKNIETIKQKIKDKNSKRQNKKR